MHWPHTFSLAANAFRCTVLLLNSPDPAGVLECLEARSLAGGAALEVLYMNFDNHSSDIKSISRLVGAIQPVITSVSPASLAYTCLD